MIDYFYTIYIIFLFIYCILITTLFYYYNIFVRLFQQYNTIIFSIFYLIFMTDKYTIK